MKPLNHIFSVIVCGWLSTAAAYDISSTVDLERYTITGNSVEYASGHLQKNGSFKVSLSYEVDPFFYGSVDNFALISGRPIMNETLFNAYKSTGFIPNWVRSQDSGLTRPPAHRNPNPLPQRRRPSPRRRAAFPARRARPAT